MRPPAVASLRGFTYFFGWAVAVLFAVWWVTR